MPAFKFSFVFNYTSGNPDVVVANRRQGGWTETLYWTSYDSSVQRALGRLAIARAALLPRSASIIGLRVQQVDPSGPATSVPLILPGGYPLTASNADIPQMALLMTVRADPQTNTRRFRLAAIPDDQVTFGEYDPTPNYRALMTAFLRGLSGWRFRGLDLTQPKKPLVTIADDGTYTTSQDIALAVGDRVKVYSTVDHEGFKRDGTFLVTTATSLRVGKLGGWTFGACTLGSMRKLVPIYPVIIADNSSIQRTVVRKIGRPFGGYRGRASKRRK